MSRLMSTIYKSLVRSVNDLIKEIQTTTGSSDIGYWSWEARGDEDKLPARTLIGLDGYNFDENKGLWIIRMGITLSSYSDANLLDEADMLDVVHDLFGYEKKVKLRNPDTGAEFSELYVTAFQIMPMGQSELRNYRSVGVELLRTDTSEA